MVRVEFSRCGGTYVLRMTGHAGQADVGHDVVCAAATILCYTVAQTALDLYEQGKLRKRPRVDIGKGDATVTRRLKGPSADAEKFRAMQPVMQMLSQRYGVDAADIKALSAAIEEDNAFYQEEAERLGISVDQVKAIRKTERENQQLKEQLAERESRQRMEQNIAKWSQEAQAIAQKYPGLDLEKELGNPQFFNALMNGASVEGAYWGLYHDQLIPQAMQYTAQETERKLAAKIQAQGQRPTENGAGAGVTMKSDVSKLSDKDMDDLIQRARRGEKICF